MLLQVLGVLCTSVSVCFVRTIKISCQALAHKLSRQVNGVRVGEKLHLD